MSASDHFGVKKYTSLVWLGLGLYLFGASTNCTANEIAPKLVRGENIQICQDFYRSYMTYWQSVDHPRFFTSMSNHSISVGDAKLGNLPQGYEWVEWRLERKEFTDDNEYYERTIYSLSDPKNIKSISGLQLVMQEFNWKGAEFWYQYTGDPAGNEYRLYSGGLNWVQSWENIFVHEDDAYFLEPSSGVYVHSGDKRISLDGGGFSVRRLTGKSPQRIPDTQNYLPSEEVCRVSNPDFTGKLPVLEMLLQQFDQYFMSSYLESYGSMGRRGVSLGEVYQVLSRPHLYAQSEFNINDIDELIFKRHPLIFSVYKGQDAWSYREVESFENGLKALYYEISQLYPENSAKIFTGLVDGILSNLVISSRFYELNPAYKSRQKLLLDRVTNLNHYGISLEQACKEYFQHISISGEFATDKKLAIVDCYSLGMDSLVNDSTGSVLRVKIDEVNSFRKTLLMYAAHMNQFDVIGNIDSARGSLSATVLPEWGLPKQRRNALDYAAENASRATYQLVENKFSGEPVNKGLKNTNWRYSPRALNYLSQSGPSYDCAQATRRQDVLICNSVTLSAYDREMKFLYQLALETNASFSIRKSQREWLRGNNIKCDYQCLSLRYRGRIRFLENLVVNYSGVK